MGRDFSQYKNNNNLLKSPYDPRDFKLSKSIPLAAMSALPDEYETPEAPFVYDQGSSSMCCACAYSMLRYLQESDTENGGSGLDEPLSPAFTYANRLPGEDFEGMFIRSCCKKGTDGSVLYSDFPGFMSYFAAKQQFNRNKQALLEKALPFAITSYHQCDKREAMMAAIMSSKGVLGGIPIYQCMYDLKGDVLKYDPNKNTQDFGGHAILFVGWKTINGKFHWRIQNSWGADWGKNGRAWIPEEYPWVENPYAIIDGNVDLIFEDYKKQYCKY